MVEIALVDIYAAIVLLQSTRRSHALANVKSQGIGLSNPDPALMTPPTGSHINGPFRRHLRPSPRYPLSQTSLVIT
jgi:hypothetical protein